jgi:EAL domain-containing protein (putative c-di-GMP-specific phosphodiesterase class I)/CHASE2 domain-containing sensor protein
MNWNPSAIYAKTIWVRFVFALLLSVLVATLASTGTFRSAENFLQLAKFEVSPREASGNIHIVEMDAASVAAIKQWPWPREHYAKVIEQLDAAGVNSIAFDVDFSSASSAESDRILANALERTNAPVIFPTFSQAASFGESRKLDSLPIEAFRDHVQLASVAVAHDKDGFVRRMPLGTVTSGVPRPSLSATLARQSGEAETSFPIDFAIDPSTIPRHSFVAIENGDFDVAALRGKDVVIGATAIEIFDRYAVPSHGVVPGVVVQALAAETLLDGTPIYGSWLLPLLVSIALGWLILAANAYVGVFVRTAIAVTSLATFAYFGQTSFLIWFEIVPAIAFIFTCTALRSIWIARDALLQNMRTDRESGLPNHIALQQQVQENTSGYVVAGMLGDFEALNAVLGRENMSVLLQRVVERLTVSGCSAPICRTEDRVLSWQSSINLGELEELLSGLRAVMRSPVEVGGRRVDVALAFGVAATNGENTVANAAHAASAALRNGEKWRLHEDERAENLEQQISLMGELDAAIRNGQVKVHYQPKLDLRANQVTCAEALVRWEHPEKGMLPPDSFIPLAEESGRIEELTLFVIRRTIEDMRDWCAADLVLGAAVNISARLLSSASFVQRAEAIFAELGVPLTRLTFEVTESSELEDPEASIGALNRFRDRGISISMDDYGTGQSTLSYLKTLPISELKIDRSFVQNAHIDRGDAMLVRSTVQLAHELGLKVVAEGIEDQGCLEYLRSIDCDYAQGYLVGRPMSAEDLASSLKTEVREAA